MEAAHPAAELHPDVHRGQVVQRAVARAPCAQISRSPGSSNSRCCGPRCWVTRAAPLNHRVWKASTGSVKSGSASSTYAPSSASRSTARRTAAATAGRTATCPPRDGRVGDPQPAHPARQARRGRSPAAGPQRDQSRESGAADHVHQQRRVRRVPGHRAHVRERAEGARRIQRHPPVRRLQREDPAEGRRDADAAAAVRAERQRPRAERHGRRAAAAGAARGARRVVRIAGHAGLRRVRDALPAELGGRRLAEEHRAVLAQPGHRRRVLVPTAALRRSVLEPAQRRARRAAAGCP